MEKSLVETFKESRTRGCKMALLDFSMVGILLAAAKLDQIKYMIRARSNARVERSVAMILIRQLTFQLITMVDF